MKLPIIISNSSGIHATPIAEHIVGFMLIFTRGFYRTFQNQQKRVWKKDETISELRGKTVLIVGLGDIGMEAARLAYTFGARVLAVTRSRKEKPAFVDELRIGDDLDKMLPKADFVAICLPYTKETHHLFDMKKFRLMKPSAVLINIGRGGIVHEKELIEALRKRIIGGAPFVRPFVRSCGFQFGLLCFFLPSPIYTPTQPPFLLTGFVDLIY